MELLQNPQIGWFIYAFRRLFFVPWLTGAQEAVNLDPLIFVSLLFYITIYVFTDVKNPPTPPAR